MRRLALGLAALVLLAGCGGPGIPGPNGRVDRPGSVISAGVNPNTPALVAQRIEAGIPDCPVVAPAPRPADYGLPSVSLPCLGSERWVNVADLRGKPMVVNLWAQWCDPCRAEAPFLSDFARAAGDDVAVIGVDVTDPSPDKAIAFAKASGWTYPHLVDAEGALSRSMQVPGIPITLLVDAGGRVVYRHTGGFTTPGQLERLVAEQLGVTLR